LQRRHLELKRAHRRISDDLKRAARIQRKLIPDPEEQPLPDRIRLAHSYVPQMAVGGDYYDFMRFEDGTLALLFADVSGHGMAGAFITGILKTIFQAMPSAEDPREFVARTNELLTRITPADNYATLVYAVYDPEKHRLVYTNAGHHPTPMVVRKEGGRVECSERADGIAAGFVAQSEYEQTEVSLQPGDRFVLCTDGITESRNRESEPFGSERLQSVLTDARTRPSQDVPDVILECVADHCGGVTQKDDQAIFCMEVLA
jgi:sigma-B regulation protein RsbU (phosphoserine phosphatase)